MHGKRGRQPHFPGKGQCAHSYRGRGGRRLTFGAVGSVVRRLFKSRAESDSTGEATASSLQGSTESETAVSTPDRPKAVAERVQPNDAQVREWKGSWVKGAESRWSGTSLLANPHKAGSSRAAAWRAGWHWADRQPDRRQPDVVRFAHAHRRRTDRSSHLVRRAQAGAVGLSVLTIAGWLWQIRRQRMRRGPEE